MTRTRSPRSVRQVGARGRRGGSRRGRACCCASISPPRLRGCAGRATRWRRGLQTWSQLGARGGRVREVPPEARPRGTRCLSDSSVGVSCSRATSRRTLPATTTDPVDQSGARERTDAGRGLSAVPRRESKGDLGLPDHPRSREHAEAQRVVRLVPRPDGAPDRDARQRHLTHVAVLHVPRHRRAAQGVGGVRCLPSRRLRAAPEVAHGPDVEEAGAREGREGGSASSARCVTRRPSATTAMGCRCRIRKDGPREPPVMPPPRS